MALSPLQLRHAMLPLVGDDTFNPVLTTTAGDAAGDDFIAAQFNDAQLGFAKGMWVMIEGGTHVGKYRYIGTGAEDGNPKTFGIQPALGSAVATALTLYLHHVPPSLYNQAINEACTYSWPWVYNPGENSSLTVVSTTPEYTLPTGYNQDNIRRVMMEGDGIYDNLPLFTLRNVSYSPDQTKLRLNMLPAQKQDGLIVGRKIFLIAELPLTRVPLVSTFGTMPSDTTAVVELTADTDPWRLFLMFAAARLFALLARQPATQNKEEMIAVAAGALADAYAQAPHLSMPRLLTKGYL